MLVWRRGRTWRMFSLVWAIVGVQSVCLGGNWPAWRGAEGDGVTRESDLPLNWSQTQNVAWKAPLPGAGNSTPIVWGERIFLTCASDKGAKRSVLCFNRSDGKLLWRRDTTFPGQEPTHEANPYCSSSPVTDGKRVYAWLGSAGAAAYDLDGKPGWQTDLGPFRHIWGNASSPILYGDALILLCGPGPRAFLTALDTETGQPRWKQELPEAAGKDQEQWKGSWSSPVLRSIEGGRSELVIALPGHVAGFDPETGKEIWRCRGLGVLVYANPLIGKDVIVAMSGYGGPALGMRLPKAGESGDLTQSHRLWVIEKNPQRVGSGVVAGDFGYILNEPGIAECFELATGKQVWKQRVAGSSWGSMVLAGERLYVTDQEGTTVILRATPKFELLARNSLGERTRASVAVSDGQLFIRTYENLYCIGKRTGRQVN